MTDAKMREAMRFFSKRCDDLDQRFRDDFQYPVDSSPEENQPTQDIQETQETRRLCPKTLYKRIQRANEQISKLRYPSRKSSLRRNLAYLRIDANGATPRITFQDENGEIVMYVSGKRYEPNSSTR